MSQAISMVRWNEELSINSGNFKPVSGTITLSSVKVTLRDAQRVAVAACTNVDATDFTSGPSSTPSALYTISPQELSLPEPVTQDTYTLTFEGNDTAENTYSSVQCLVIKPRGV